jgi:hypothetical protein
MNAPGSGNILGPSIHLSEKSACRLLDLGVRSFGWVRADLREAGKSDNSRLKDKLPAIERYEKLDLTVLR